MRRLLALAAAAVDRDAGRAAAAADARGDVVVPDATGEEGSIT